MRSISAELIRQIDPARPVLIAGPTASGKSALALEIAETQGGVIVNADAIQVFDDWRILTARPPAEDESRAKHLLYGHIPGHQDYSVGHWLREVTPLLNGPERLIIVGGTGLYFTALTQGLADIPPTPAQVRAECEAQLASQGLASLIADLDAASRDRIDLQNPARVSRAWEVLQSTGRGIADWQDNTPPPLLPLDQTFPILFDAPKDWLTPRIERRFDLMIAQGALDEARANLDTWHPKLPSAKAIGATELIVHLRGELSLEEACTRATILTRQFAKRQRTWFNARMKSWTKVSPQDAVA
ncbi:tRNA (adenosine(37)-N6)-dimethylallyltransferase MiaA [Tropicibacter sp. R15_0]|uniref:tRNA (adenosine(37)-N6)-dimethylallyltransferase MiaA n=1 Tax=Tropicibacter sp. R15_0 TaxID=2821101 RepID=UPI001ADA6379|nr:tRNA (adenosine(37)-N6)-dimethylallyltransferase MiaA [Tropicibacter sp. R15_0]MBO9464859.1 tRNA (adenosine(37)-N6)-dimethylallyltransferase MiaA [Tropicibacter sp. R15_0]